MLLKKLIVLGLSKTCTALDSIPGVWIDEDGVRFVRYSDLGCMLGLSEKSAHLDDKWDTQVWEEVA